MNLSEISAKIKRQQDELVPEWEKLAAQGRTAHQVVVDTQTLVVQQENLLRGELARIVPGVSALQTVLTQGFTQIQARLDACEVQVGELKSLTATAHEQLAGAAAEMQEKSDQLAQSIPDVRNRLHNLLEEQRQLLVKDCQEHQAAQERLRATLELLNRTVQNLTGETDTQRIRAEGHVNACAERSANAIQELTTASDAFAQQEAATSQSYASALTELLDGSLKPGSQRLGQRTVQGLQDEVLTPARSAVDDLRERALEALGAQVQAQLPDLTQQRKTLDGSLKELSGGPQLLALLKRAKPVLQRIGKLQALGLQNI